MHTFLQVTALLMAIVSSIFLVKGMLVMSVKDMAERSKSGAGYTPSITEHLARQKADTVVGSVLILLSFCFQSINFLRPMRWDDFGVNKIGFIIAIVVSIGISFAAFGVSIFLRKKWHSQAKDILQAGVTKESKEILTMNWKKGFRRVTFVLAIFVAVICAGFTIDIVISKHHRAQNYLRHKQELYRNRPKRIEDLNFEVVPEEGRVPTAEQLKELEKGFWVNLSKEGLVGLCVLAGLIGAVVGFCGLWIVVWLLYRLFRWLVLGFVEDEQKQ